MKKTTLVSLARFLALAPIAFGSAYADTTTSTTTPTDQDILSLDPYNVNSTTQKPFTDANIDTPRTINDIQPYYIYDAKTIDQSGATSVEGFLRDRVTMNNVISTNTENTTSYGTSSAVSLRGLGVTETLILVDGRRLPAVYVAGSVYQGDLNGIPMAAIDHIEVMPSSSSGLYGGSALAGVINIVTKKNYTGGEVRATYDTSFDTDDAISTFNVSYGASLENGKTHLLVSANYSSAHDLMLGDRLGIYEANLAAILKRAPTNFYTALSPFQGATTNISSATVNNLVLKTGATLPSNYTHIGAGTTAASSASDVAAGLLANAGTYDMRLPAINGGQDDTQSPLGFTPETKGVNLTLSRQMNSWLEADVYFTYDSNKGVEQYDGYFNQSNYVIPATAPDNPFTTAVTVKMPATLVRPRVGPDFTRTFAGSLKIKLPGEWLGLIDYSAAINYAGHFLSVVDGTAFQADLNTGVLNPFVDELTTGYYKLDKYLETENFSYHSTQDSFEAKANGPLPKLPWGTPTLTIGAEDRIGGQENGTLAQNLPLTPASSSLRTYYGFKQITKAAYAELLLPLVKKNTIPLIYDFEFQGAVRAEQFNVATGTPQQTYTPATGLTTYTAPVNPTNGLPFRGNTTYTAKSPTFGFKWEPVEQLAIRASYAKAFLPPTAAQLIENPIPNVGLTTITDPVNGTQYGVTTVGGGNPNLQPQSSRSFNFGAIWAPTWSFLKGWRFDAEYTRIMQKNAISTLSAQVLLNDASQFPGRVTRDPTTGLVTQIDISSLNLYSRDQEDWDFSADYRLPTAIGTFTWHGMESLVLHSRFQYSLLLPQYDDVGFPEETGGALKFRLTSTLGWEYKHWNASLTTRYYDRYHVYGGAGGGISVQNAGGGDYSTYAAAQGGEFIGSQIYHDITVGYAFGKFGSDWHYVNKILDGLSIQAGVKNVFNQTPAFDAGAFAQIGYISGFADIRLRDGWVTLKKAF